MMDFDELVIGAEKASNADVMIHRANSFYGNEALRTMDDLRQVGKLCDVVLDIEGKIVSAISVICTRQCNEI